MRGALCGLWCPSQHCAVEFFEFEFVKFLIGQSIALLVCTWLGVNFCFVCLRTRINDKRRPEFSFVPKCDTQIRIFKYGGGKEVATGGRNSKRNFSTSLWQGFVEKFVLEHELDAQMETIETKPASKGNDGVKTYETSIWWKLWKKISLRRKLMKFKCILLKWKHPKIGNCWTKR